MTLKKLFFLIIAVLLAFGVQEVKAKSFTHFQSDLTVYTEASDDAYPVTAEIENAKFEGKFAGVYSDCKEGRITDNLKYPHIHPTDVKNDLKQNLYAIGINYGYLNILKTGISGHSEATLVSIIKTDSKNYELRNTKERPFDKQGLPGRAFLSNI